VLMASPNWQKQKPTNATCMLSASTTPALQPLPHSVHSHPTLQAKKLNLRLARLDPRDVSLFAERRGFSNQRATLMPREGSILFRTEITRSIIMADRAWIFQSRWGLHRWRGLCGPSLHCIS